MASIIIAYGIVLAGFAYILQQAAPALARVAFVAGLGGGALCVFWGVLGLAGHKRRAWAVLTLVAVTLVVLSQAVQAWMASASEESGRLAGALLLTLMMLLSVAMLMYLLHGERPAGFYLTGTARRNNAASGGRDAESARARHQPESD